MTIHLKPNTVIVLIVDMIMLQTIFHVLHKNLQIICFFVAKCSANEDGQTICVTLGPSSLENVFLIF